VKYYLFIDNFRGFANAWIPLADVNFLVGENSTGKTSLMSLLKVFSGPRFLVPSEQELGDEHVAFGHFSDMVSAHSNDRSYFHIGLVWQTKEEGQQKATISAWLCTYREQHGLPSLSRFSHYSDSRSTSLRFVGDEIYSKTTTYDKPMTPDEITGELFPEWVQEHLGGERGYDKLDTAGYPARVPLFLALALTADKVRRGGKRGRRKAPVRLEDLVFMRHIAWVAPIRTKPKRTYDELRTDFSPEGAHTPYLIRSRLRSGDVARDFETFIQKIGKSSGLFDDIKIKDFGDDITAPFEVDVVLDGRPLNLSTVGYGVSQSLPVVVELLARGPETWFAIQQPEVHLHPRAQAALGDLIFEMAVTQSKHFLVETHSDFMIDRFRLNYRRDNPSKPDAQILFFERHDQHNTVTPIRIGHSGELPADQPNSYRDFFVREERRLLEIE
jgi:hypothetical protein